LNVFRLNYLYFLSTRITSATTAVLYSHVTLGWDSGEHEKYFLSELSIILFVLDIRGRAMIFAIDPPPFAN
jgi:hypothetical protein